MSYIGRGVDAISNVEKLDNITFDGSATYALTKSSAAFTPVGANNILVSIDGVIQQGNFSVSTTNIVFDWSPTSSNTCNFILHYGTGVLNVPADGSIVAAKMAANSVDSDAYVDGSIDAAHIASDAVTTAKILDDNVTAAKMADNSVDSDAYVDASIDTAHIGATQVTGAKLNTDVISAQTALAVAPADTDEFMVSDAGVLKRIDYSLIKAANTPAFSAYLNSGQTIAGGAEVIIGYDTELFDSDSAYNTSTFKFTPQTAGKYYISGSLSWNSSVAFYNELKMWKNGTGGSQYGRFGFTNGTSGGGSYFGARCTAIVDLNGSSDYVQMGLYQYSGSNKDSLYGLEWMQFMGFLLIGA